MFGKIDICSGGVLVGLFLGWFAFAESVTAIVIGENGKTFGDKTLEDEPVLDDVFCIAVTVEKSEFGFGILEVICAYLFAGGCFDHYHFRLEGIARIWRDKDHAVGKRAADDCAGKINEHDRFNEPFIAPFTDEDLFESLFSHNLSLTS